jgi:hypothetical protein
MVVNCYSNCVLCGCTLTALEMLNGAVCAECDGECAGKKTKLHGRLCSTDDLPRPEVDDEGNIIS